MNTRRLSNAVFCLALAFLFLFTVCAATAPTYAAAKMKLNKTKATLYVEQTLKLKVTGTKSKVKWSSSKKAVAKVSAKGKVTALKKGKANIIAKIGKKKLTCKITVKNKPVPVPTPTDGSIAVCLASEPESLDPTLIITLDQGSVMSHLFSGLARCEEKNGRLVYVPDMAEALVSPVENADHTFTYTYKIRQNARWSDGKPVTASDFVYAWNRALDEDLWADYSYLFEYIKGYDTGDLAVKAVDDSTLQVTALGEYAFWEQMLAFPVFYPVRSDIVDNEGNWSKTPATCISNGLYTLDSWTHDSVIMLKKNELHPDAARVTMPEIQFYLSSDPAKMVSDYRAGTLQFIDEVDFSKVKTTDPELHMPGAIGTYYCTWNSNADLSPVGGTALNGAQADEVREALNGLINRTELVATCAYEETVPASSFVGMGVTEPDGSEFYQHAGHAAGHIGYFPLEGDKANALSVLGKYYNVSGGKVTNFPAITYLTNSGSGHTKIAGFIRAQLADIGITMTVDEKEWGSEYTTAIADGAFTICRSGWIADFDDAANFLEIFTTDGYSNYARLGKDRHAGSSYTVDLSDVKGYSSLSGNWQDTYDVLISYSRTEQDKTIRNQLLHKAEDLLMQTGCVCPLYYYTDAYMLSSKVNGFYHSPLGLKYFMFTTVSQ